MRRITIVSGAVLVMVLSFGWPQGVKADIGPRAELTETTHDFGKVFEDRALSHTFAIKNTGDALLVIKHIDSDCACTAAEADRRIAPGMIGRITLTIAPYSVLRQFTKKTTLFLNDPDNPEVVLTMQGYGMPAIEIQPSHIIRFRGKPGEELRSQVKLISHLPEPWEIKETQTNIPDAIGIKITPESSGRIYVLEVTSKWRQAGKYAGMIELLTSSKKRPRIIIRVFGEFESPAAER